MAPAQRELPGLGVDKATPTDPAALGAPEGCLDLGGVLAEQQRRMQATMSTERANLWVREYTERKELHYRGLVRMHLQIVHGLKSRYGWARTMGPYLYFDCHAGRGLLDYKGRTFVGSPLIFLDEAQQKGLDFRALFFERDPAEAELLRPNLSDGCQLVVDDCERAITNLLGPRRPLKNWGLVYADPIGGPIPVELFMLAAQKLPHVELLSYVSATNYKNGRGGPNRHGRRLGDDIAAIAAAGKPKVLVREPVRSDQHQFTFVLWSAWEGFPDWKKEGFHSLDSDRGQQILNVLTHTRAEREEAFNRPLPWDNCCA